MTFRIIAGLRWIERDGVRVLQIALQDVLLKANPSNNRVFIAKQEPAVWVDAPLQEEVTQEKQ